MTIKEFKDQSNIEIIESIMKMNNGYVTSKELSNLGIHRMYLNIMKEKGMIEKVGNGIYIDSSKIEDSYFVLGLELSNIIYSHMTALYFHGLSIKASNDKYDITVPNNYFNYKIKNHNVFYVDKDIYELGLIQIDTPMGNKVKAYDMERCICDIIRSKNRMDSEHVKHSIREYVKRKDKDLVKLSKYAEKLGIKKEVMDYVEVFMNSMQLKDKLRNISKEKNVNFNTLLRLYKYDRFLERLSKSKYRDNFVLKGGFYLRTLFGVENRATMDIDTAFRNANFNEDTIVKMIKEIVSIKIDDNAKLSYLGIEPIRD